MRTPASNLRGTTPRRVSARLRRTAVLLLTAFAVTLPATAAWAYWASAGTGTGHATTSTLAAATWSSVSTPAGSSSVNLAWTAAHLPSGTAASGYYVTRTNTATQAAAAGCASSAAQPLTSLSCADSSVPAGNYTYTVTAIYHSWSATSAASSPVTVDPATQLAFSVQPAGSTAAGTAIIPAVTVTVEDSAGAAVQAAGTSITVSLHDNPAGGTLTGTLTAVTDSTGTASFANLAITKAGGGYTLGAASTGLTSAISNSFTITPASAAQLSFGQQPTNTASMTAITPAVTVKILDQYGNLTSSTANVTVALTAPTGTRLFGTLTKAAVAGVATFSDLSVDKAGTGYTLTVSSSGASSATSSTFAITTGRAAAIAVSAGAQQFTTNNTAFATGLVALVTDAGGNPVPGASVTFTAPGTGASGSFAQTAAVTTDANGLAHAPTLTANTTLGTWNATATLTGTSTTASFLLANTSPQSRAHLTPSVSSASAGTTITLSGPGWTFNATLTATFNASAVTLTNGATSSDGHIVSGCSFKVPSLPAGTYLLFVKDSGGLAQAVDITVS